MKVEIIIIVAVVMICLYIIFFGWKSSKKKMSDNNVNAGEKRKVSDRNSDDEALDQQKPVIINQGSSGGKNPFRMSKPGTDIAMAPTIKLKDKSQKYLKETLKTDILRVPFRIGSGKKCNISIPDPQLSNVQLEFNREMSAYDTYYTAQWMGKTNPVFYMNEEKDGRLVWKSLKGPGSEDEDEDLLELELGGDYLFKFCDRYLLKISIPYMPIELNDTDLMYAGEMKKVKKRNVSSAYNKADFDSEKNAEPENGMTEDCYGGTGYMDDIEV